MPISSNEVFFMVNVLIVDDDAINSKVFSKRLNKRGFSTRIVDSGQECLKVLDEDNSYIVLLDIVMPDMDGIEVLKEIRKKWAQTETPVIMLSSNEEVEQIVHCLTLKASDYITKPANIDIACARISAQSSLQRLSNENMKKNQVETINSMVITFNHEINNPLTIAIGALKRDFSKITEKRALIALESLYRIARIVKKIERVTHNGDVEEETYADNRKMIKLK
jgi:DNA-binding response OmpR family regulator